MASWLRTRGAAPSGPAFPSRRWRSRGGPNRRARYRRPYSRQQPSSCSSEIPAKRCAHIANAPQRRQGRARAVDRQFSAVSRTTDQSFQRVEVVEQAGDAGIIELVHDGTRAPRRGDDVERAHPLLHATDLARRHGEVPDTEADQQSRESRVAGHLAAEADADARAQRRLDRELYEPQDRRMQRIVKMRHLLVAAVDRQRVLDEIVGPDREEIA